MNTYQNYLLCDLSLSFETMLDIHAQLLESISNDELALELYTDLIEQATRYADYRAKWFTWTNEEKAIQDPSRTKCHNVLIDKFNILARYIKSLNLSIEWRNILGDEKSNPYIRKRIGDFAVFLVFINSLNAR